MPTKAVAPFPVLCVNARPLFTDIPTNLTEGKRYMVVAVAWETHYQVQNDANQPVLYLKTRFRTEEEENAFYDKLAEEHDDGFAQSHQ